MNYARFKFQRFSLVAKQKAVPCKKVNIPRRLNPHLVSPHLGSAKRSWPPTASPTVVGDGRSRTLSTPWSKARLTSKPPHDFHLFPLSPLAFSPAPGTPEPLHSSPNSHKEIVPRGSALGDVKYHTA